MTHSKVKDVPSVLVIGLQFDQTTGGGVTMTNLFCDWPRERISIVCNGSPTTETRAKVRSFFQVQGHRCSALWPDWRRHYCPPEGPVKLDMGGMIPSETDLSGRVSQHGRPGWRRFLAKVVENSSLGEWSDHRQPSLQLVEWVREIRPDLIYGVLNSFMEIRFVRALVKLTGVPLAVHIMDDWPRYKYRNHIVGHFLRRQLDIEFRDLLQCTTRRLGICQSMCDAYHIRYGGEWHPFHNPIECSIWRVHARKQWESGSPFRMLYGGRIGRGIWNSLVDVGQAVSVLSREGVDITFEIRTPDLTFPVVSQLRKLTGIQVLPPLPYDEVPANLAQADLLVIPYDFDDNSKIASQLSMPTKVAEYMASGTPILIYAPINFAITQYALAEQWGMAVTTPGVHSLKAAILSLLKDARMRERFGSQAMIVAERNHSADRVRESFRQVLSGVSR